LVSNGDGWTLTDAGRDLVLGRPEPWVKKLETPRAIPGELRLGTIRCRVSARRSPAMPTAVSRAKGFLHRPRAVPERALTVAYIKPNNFPMTWRKGESGNPKGRKPGLALKLTTELRAIVSKDAKEIVSSIIAAAKAGDVEARRVFARHFLPQTKWPTVFDLPPIDGPTDIPGAVKAMLDAAAKGDIALEDAGRVIELLDGLRQAHEGTTLAERLDEMEARLVEMSERERSAT
jgi:hypothetical protein